MELDEVEQNVALKDEMGEVRVVGAVDVLVVGSVENIDVQGTETKLTM